MNQALPPAQIFLATVVCIWGDGLQKSLPCFDFHSTLGKLYLASGGVCSKSYNMRLTRTNMNAYQEMARNQQWVDLLLCETQNSSSPTDEKAFLERFNANLAQLGQSAFVRDIPQSLNAKQ
jgi:hypothetical protein